MATVTVCIVCDVTKYELRLSAAGGLRLAHQLVFVGTRVCTV